MENYIGRKCKGFRFEGDIDGISWITDMETHIGEIGVITKQYNTYVAIGFENSYSYFYPISLIEPHLIPDIPQLVEGVLMEVSDDNKIWFVDNYSTLWKYARPIPEVKKYTKEELIKILGHDFEIV